MCRFDAIKNFTINPLDCEGRGACTLVCPQNAIKLEDEKTAETFIAQLDDGIISRAQMEIGSDAVLIVTEPTKSGLADLMRVVVLCQHFGIFVMVCINKYDINEEMSEEIEKYINEQELVLAGKIPYDSTVMKSINELKPITYYKDSIAEKAIECIWNKIKKYLYREDY